MDEGGKRWYLYLARVVGGGTGMLASLLSIRRKIADS